MTPKIERSQKPTTDRQVRALEKSLKIRLPQDYRSFLLQNNGGKPDPDGFDVETINGPKANSRVGYFLAIHDGKQDSFEDYFNTYKVKATRIPAHLVPIAHDSKGNLICIAVTGRDVGAVHFWDKDDSVDDGADNCHLLAKNFDEFLNALH
jgi:cell wall assembly regulator SMI1